jgi:hypothetical protein
MNMPLKIAVVAAAKLNSGFILQSIGSGNRILASMSESRIHRTLKRLTKCAYLSDADVPRLGFPPADKNSKANTSISGCYSSCRKSPTLHSASWLSS